MQEPGLVPRYQRCARHVEMSSYVYKAINMIFARRGNFKYSRDEKDNQYSRHRVRTPSKSPRTIGGFTPWRVSPRTVHVPLEVRACTASEDSFQLAGRPRRARMISSWYALV